MLQPTSKHVVRTYVLLTLFSTLAASFIWGINTLFLLDAGLSISQAFAANAFFAGGQVLFEIPTGVVADTFGRRTSFLLGAATLTASTLLYFYLWQIEGPFWAWAVVSALLGLGFTFFSGATDAWLVDALDATGFEGSMESVFATGQIATGAAMLFGSVAGGLIASALDLGIAYLFRVGFLVVTLVVAFVWMHDLGFKPKPVERLGREVKKILRSSVKYGLGNPPVRWLMLASPFLGGVSFYAFYAAQPYLLALHGDRKAYWIAGLAAAIFAGAQIIGGLIVPLVHRLFRTRTGLLLLGVLIGALSLGLLGFIEVFWVALVLLSFWGIVFAAMTPVRQTLMNSLIPSEQRATVLSMDNLLSSVGGTTIQPALGKVADVWSYPASYLVSGGVQLLALPFTWLARREKVAEDTEE